MINKNLYFKNIILFVEHIKNIVIIKSDALIKINFNINLKDLILK